MHHHDSAHHPAGPVAQPRKRATLLGLSALDRGLLSVPLLLVLWLAVAWASGRTPW